MLNESRSTSISYRKTDERFPINLYRTTAPKISPKICRKKNLFGDYEENKMISEIYIKFLIYLVIIAFWFYCMWLVCYLGTIL